MKQQSLSSTAPQNIGALSAVHPAQPGVCFQEFGTTLQSASRFDWCPWPGSSSSSLLAHLQEENLQTEARCSRERNRTGLPLVTTPLSVVSLFQTNQKERSVKYLIGNHNVHSETPAHPYPRVGISELRQSSLVNS